MLLLAALGGAAGVWRQVSDAEGIDYYQFWVVGRALAEDHRADVYGADGRRDLGGLFLDRARRDGGRAQRAAAEHRRVLDAYATPVLYAVARATTTGDYEADLRRHQAAALAAFVLSTLALGHVFGHSRHGNLALLCALLWFFDPLASDLRVGNVNSIQLVWITGVLWILRGAGSQRRREVACGAILALGTLYKPNLAPAACLVGLVRLLAAGPWGLSALAAGAAGAAAVAGAGSMIAFGSVDCWLRWLAAWRALPETLITTDLGNFAPAQLGREVLGIPAWPVAWASAGLAAALAWRLSRGRGHAGGLSVAAAAGPLIGLLGGRLAWEHYYVLAVPMLSYAMRPAQPFETGRRTTARQVAGGAALLAMSVTPAMWLGPAWPVAGYAVVAATGAALLLSTAFAAGARPPGPRRPREMSRRRPGAIFPS